MGVYSLTPLEKISSRDLVKYKSRGGEKERMRERKGETDGRKEWFCTNGLRNVCTDAKYLDSFVYISLLTSKGVPILVGKDL